MKTYEVKRPAALDLNSWDETFHDLMLDDSIRMNAYKKAIQEQVKQGDIVVDLGTGTGILAQWALEAGASKVYGIEFNENILEIAKAKENKELIQYVKDCYEQASDKRIIVFSKSCPFQFVLPKHEEPLFVIIPYQKSQFVVIAVKEQDSSVDRLLFPTEWKAKSGNELQEATGIADLHFCHGQGFMLIANTLDSAKAAAEKAIQIS